jgi:hypothetical protein
VNTFLSELMPTSTSSSPVDAGTNPLDGTELSPIPLANTKSPPSHTHRDDAVVDGRTIHPSDCHRPTRPNPVDATELVVKCTTCQHEISLDAIDAHSKRCVVRATVRSWIVVRIASETVR